MACIRVRFRARPRSSKLDPARIIHEPRAGKSGAGFCFEDGDWFRAMAKRGFRTGRALLNAAALTLRVRLRRSFLVRLEWPHSTGFDFRQVLSMQGGSSAPATPPNGLESPFSVRKRAREPEITFGRGDISAGLVASIGPAGFTEATCRRNRARLSNRVWSSSVCRGG
jgi:hypothetical protein